MAGSITFLTLLAAPWLFQTLDIFRLLPALAALGPLLPVCALTAAAAAITRLTTAAILAFTHTGTPERTTGGGRDQ